jgi:hypothetical protein
MRALYVMTNVLVPIVGIISGLLIFMAVSSMARGLPDKSVLKGFDGKKVLAQVEINGISVMMTLLINEKQLALRSRWPSIGLILDLDELKISEVKSLIGKRVRVTSLDAHVNHMFYELLISRRIARKLYHLSGRCFDYDNV